MNDIWRHRFIFFSCFRASRFHLPHLVASSSRHPCSNQGLHSYRLRVLTARVERAIGTIALSALHSLPCKVSNGGCLGWSRKIGAPRRRSSRAIQSRGLLLPRPVGLIRILRCARNLNGAELAETPKVTVYANLLADPSRPLEVRWVCQADRQAELERQRAEKARQDAASTQSRVGAGTDRNACRDLRPAEWAA